VNSKKEAFIHSKFPVAFIRYRDHVLFHQGNPLSLKPALREAVGWLVYENPEYVILAWDRDVGPPTLRGGDPKASGLVVLRSDIVQLKRIR